MRYIEKIDTFVLAETLYYTIGAIPIPVNGADADADADADAAATNGARNRNLHFA